MEVITPKDIAKELKLHERTVRRMLGKGTIKGFKVGGSWRSTRDDLNEYIGGQNEAHS